MGASRDKPEALNAFKTKHKLSYSFISDGDGSVATALGILPGKRQTVVISKDGKIEKIYTTVSAGTHAKDVLKDLGK